MTANTPLGPRFSAALSFAADLHAGQCRKGTTTPYVAHLLAVAALVIEAGGDEDAAIAALLHDAVEDRGGRETLERIRERFGSTVADVVAECSDTDTIPKPPWRARKEAYLDAIPHKSTRALLVSVADKLHNARAILADHHAIGDRVWDRFNGGLDGTLWYYAALVDALRGRTSAELWTALDATVSELNAAVRSGRRRAAANGDARDDATHTLPGHRRPSRAESGSIGSQRTCGVVVSGWTFPYRRQLTGGLLVASARPEHAEALEDLQRLVFPTLADAQRFKAAHYRRHVELFGEGQLVGLDGERVVAATATIRLHFDFDHIGHTFADIIQGGWLTSHEPDGDWLYGADLGVHPDYRGRGLAHALYAARHELVRALGLRGQVAVGMMSGYGALKTSMTPQAYLEEVRGGRLIDPTLTPQQRLGFELRRLVPDYLDDPVCDNCGVLIVLEASKRVGRVSPSASPR